MLSVENIFALIISWRCPLTCLDSTSSTLSLFCHSSLRGINSEPSVRRWSDWWREHLWQQMSRDLRSSLSIHCHSLHIWPFMRSSFYLPSHSLHPLSPSWLVGFQCDAAGLKGECWASSILSAAAARAATDLDFQLTRGPPMGLERWHRGSHVEVWDMVSVGGLMGCLSTAALDVCREFSERGTIMSSHSDTSSRVLLWAAASLRFNTPGSILRFYYFL